jgi:hypothetical protein
MAGDRHNCDRYAPSTRSSLMKRSHPMQLTSSKVTTTVEPSELQCVARTSVSFQSLATVLLCSPLPLCNTSGLLENWLRLIRDVYRLHKDYLDLIEVNLMIVDICCSVG